MKIIDLLNKIANGEEVPQKIKIDNKIYNYETFNIGKGDSYLTAEWVEVKGYRISYDDIYYYLEIRDYNLNDEVEIIEEPQEHKIPEKLSFILYGDDIAEIPSNEMLMNKINEIIDYLEKIK